MAISQVLGPGDNPETVADWQKITNIFQTTWLRLTGALIVNGSSIMKGSAVNIGGAWYVATSDTAITGSASEYVKLTVSGSSVTAAFVANLTGVNWNKEWNGWYNASGEYYIFDEVKAFGAGAISTMHSMAGWRPSATWSRALSRVLSETNLDRLFRLDNEVMLTGSGNWTVPSGVYFIEVEMIGPGNNGSAGSSGTSGNGGTSGQELRFSQRVTPGQVIAYNVSGASTIFGATTALKGQGWPGQTGATPRGGIGGGVGGGHTGAPNAVANSGGGGMGGPEGIGGANVGLGATGYIKIR
jgi:hypothetical protein